MAPVEFQILSDLHLEAPKVYDIFEIVPHAPYLVLAGDIGCAAHAGLYEFLQAQLEKFQKVFFLFGNHEPYGQDWPATKAALRDFATRMTQLRVTTRPSLGEFVVLDQTRYDVSDEVTLLGCTLFSRIGPTRHEMDSVSFGLNDFYDIRDWTVEQHNEAHAADLAWLNAQVAAIASAEPQRRILVCTHYSPTQDARAIDPAHSGSVITSGFSTDLAAERCWTDASVKMWAFGHTHWNCSFQSADSELRVVANQRGYYFAQASGFDLGLVVEV